MAWVCIALSVPVLFLLLLYLFKIRFSVDLQTPAVLRGSLGISFLWFRREIALDAARAFKAHPDEKRDGDRDREKGGDKVGENNAAENRPADTSSGGNASGPREDGSPGGQRGAMRVPEAWLGFLSRQQIRLRQAGIKWAMDFTVWRILFRYTLKSGRRVLGLLRPALKFLHLGMEDVYDLGRIAALWSVLSGTLPALACPTEFGFNERSFNFQAKVAGGFTGLNAFFFGMLTLFSFPWIPLGIRFVHCWRDPRLNRWQRRVLLP